MITTCGIANNNVDAPVYFENVLGVVVWQVPMLGFALSWLATTHGKIIAITIIISMVIIWILAGLIFDKKNKKKTTVEIEKGLEANTSDFELGAWLLKDYDSFDD